MKKVALLILLLVLIASLTLMTVVSGSNDILVSPSGDGGGRAILDSIFFLI